MLRRTCDLTTCVCDGGCTDCDGFNIAMALVYDVADNPLVALFIGQ